MRLLLHSSCRFLDATSPKTIFFFFKKKGINKLGARERNLEITLTRKKKVFQLIPGYKNLISKFNDSVYT